MLNSEIEKHRSSFPEGFRRDFDAHVYYETPERESALSLHARALSEFAEAPVFIGAIVPQPVGPHPVPMFEMNFPRELFERVFSWLRNQRGSLTVLIHEVTGDDPRDHSQGAIWLGKPLPLDESKLDPSPAERAGD